MKFSKNLALLIFVSSFTTPALAEIEGGVNGRVRGSVRSEEKTSGSKEQFTTQYRFDTWVNISESGCLKMRGRIDSGGKYNSERDDWGLFDGEVEFNLNLRHVYFDTNCFMENVQLQAGALDVKTNGSLGLSSYGWVDGARVIVNEDANGRQWLLTVGQVEHMKAPNVFDRTWEGLNLYQLEVSQKFTENGKAFVSVAEFEDQGFHRAGIEWALKEVADWMSGIGGEALFADDKKVGELVFFDVNAAGWKVRLMHTDIDREAYTAMDELAPKSFLGYDENYYIEGNRKFGEKNELFLVVRDGDAGAYGEIGFTRSIGKKR